MKTLLAALAALALSVYSAGAEIVEEALGCKSDPCIISYSPGGYLNRFENAANAIRHGARTLVVVDGACKSACTILIDRIPERVCLTEKARLYFHQGSEYILKWMGFPSSDATLQIPLMAYSEERRFTPLYSPVVANWIRDIGGLPRDGAFVEMPPAIAKKIWLPCKIQAHGLY